MFQDLYLEAPPQPVSGSFHQQTNRSHPDVANSSRLLSEHTYCEKKSCFKASLMIIVSFLIIPRQMFFGDLLIKAVTLRAQPVVDPFLSYAFVIEPAANEGLI